MQTNPIKILPTPVASALVASVVATTPLLVVAVLGINLAAKHIQAVAHMKHGVRVNAIVTGIAAT